MHESRAPTIYLRAHVPSQIFSQSEECIVAMKRHEQVQNISACFSLRCLNYFLQHSSSARQCLRGVFDVKIDESKGTARKKSLFLFCFIFKFNDNFLLAQHFRCEHSHQMISAALAELIYFDLQRNIRMSALSSFCGGKARLWILFCNSTIFWSSSLLLS